MTLIESIYNEPEKWRITECTLIHESGAELWICNGRSRCRPYPGGSYGWIDRRRAWRAYRWWTSNAPVEIIGSKSFNLIESMGNE